MTRDDTATGGADSPSPALEEAPLRLRDGVGLRGTGHQQPFCTEWELHDAETTNGVLESGAARAHPPSQ